MYTDLRSQDIGSLVLWTDGSHLWLTERGVQPYDGHLSKRAGIWCVQPKVDIRYVRGGFIALGVRGARSIELDIETVAKLVVSDLATLDRASVSRFADHASTLIGRASKANQSPG